MPPMGLGSEVGPKGEPALNAPTRQRVRVARLSLLGLLLVGLMACGPKKVLVGGVEYEGESAAQALLQAGEQAQGAGDLNTAELRFEELLSSFPDSPSTPAALSGMGQIMLARGDCDAARGYQHRLIRDYPLSTYAAEAQSAYSACKGRDGAIAETPNADAKRNAEARFEAAQSPAEKIAVAQAAAKAFDADNAFVAFKWRIRAYDLAEGDAKQAIYQGLLKDLETKLSFVEVRQLLETLPPEHGLVEPLTLRLAKIQIHTRELNLAKETLHGYLSRWPKGAFEPEARLLLQRIEAGEHLEPHTIGVLLPLSGRHRLYGKLALDAIRLALGIPKDRTEGQGIRIAIYDTQSQLERAAPGVRKLVAEDGAIVVLGGIFTHTAEAAAYEAQAIGVPLITISRSEKLGEIGPFVFRNGLSNQDQIEVLLRHVIDDLGMRRFAILYPRHPYGYEMLNLFWDGVEQKGGEISAVGAYSPGDTTFTMPVRGLVGRTDMLLRSDYLKALSDCKAETDPYRRSRCRSQASKTLKPIIDFDGLFIPDYPNQITMIAAAVAFEDIFVERDPRRLRVVERTLGRKITPITLLGANTWNSSELPKKAGRNVENAIFTDAFFPESGDRATTDFMDAYVREFNRQPRLYPEALFFDSAKIVAGIMATKPESREVFRERLSQLQDFMGVTGKIAFAGGNDAKRSVKLLTIKNGRIEEIPAAVAVPPKR